MTLWIVVAVSWLLAAGMLIVGFVPIGKLTNDNLDDTDATDDAEVDAFLTWLWGDDDTGDARCGD